MFDEHGVRVESEFMSDFSRVMRAGRLDDVIEDRQSRNSQLNIDPDEVKNGLGQLVLTLVRLIHELLERQAIRRIEAGSLTDDEIENVGVALMRQAEEIDRLRREFNLEEEDLNLDLGPLGRLL